jgi:hypothetical protein
MTNNVVVDEIRKLSPIAILGHGFPQSPSQAARTPHLIAVDAGSSAHRPLLPHNKSMEATCC